jgi:hypothetical protein
LDTAPALDLARYLDAVRRELVDLGADEVDELTGGLEADLAEAMAASQDLSKTPVQVFGPPEAYATELRAAAGIVPRQSVRRRSRWSWIFGSAVFGRALVKASDQIRVDVRAQFGSVVAGQIWWPPLRDFLRAARPSWWAFRAFLAYWYLAQLGSQPIHEPMGQRMNLPHSPLTWLAMAGLFMLSVELGRRRWPAVVGAAVVAVELWLLIVVLLVLPISVYWAW